MSDFYELAQRAEQDPHTADFAALRQLYVASDAYRPLKHITHSKLMQVTDNLADHAAIATTCQHMLEAVPLDLEARMMLAFAQEGVGARVEAELSHAFAERLLDAIIATGDGKSFEAAFKLVAEAEAWTLMRVFGIKAKDMTRHRRDDRVYDVYSGLLDGETVQIYFDMSHPVQVLDTTLTDTANDDVDLDTV